MPVLEPFTRLSESRLWRDLVAYYSAQGTKAFTSGAVPWRITTSAFLAQAYADVVVAFAKDAQRDGLADADRPVTVVELGAGTGRLTFLLLKELGRQWAAAGLESVPVRVVLTDAAPKNVEAARRHPQLQPFLEGKVLDCCVLDAEKPQHAPLRLDGPTVVLANYVFDSLPQDVFSFEAGVWRETQLELRAADVQTASPDALELTFRTEPLRTPVYVDPARDKFLHQYAAALGSGAFGFPVGALEVLDRWAQQSAGPLLVLCADKGCAHPTESTASSTPTVARHGSVSFQLNFHALQAHAAAVGGHSALAGRSGPGLRVLAWACAQTPWREAASAFSKSLQRFEPLELQQVLDAAALSHETLSVETLLALWALTRFDPDFAARFGDALRRVAGTLPPERSASLVRAAESCWANTFALEDATDPAFELATVLQQARQPSAAAFLYEQSLLRQGEHPTTLFNLALCLANVGKVAPAREVLDRLLVLAPDHERGRALREALL